MVDKHIDPFEDESIDAMDMLDAGLLKPVENQEQFKAEMEQAARNTLKQMLTPFELAKRDMAKVISAVIARRKLTQMEAAKILNTTQAKISHLKRGKVDGITFDWLVTAVMVLDRNITIGMKKHAKNVESTIRVQAA